MSSFPPKLAYAQIYAFLVFRTLYFGDTKLKKNILCKVKRKNLVNFLYACHSSTFYTTNSW